MNIPLAVATIIITLACVPCYGKNDWISANAIGDVKGEIPPSTIEFQKTKNDGIAAKYGSATIKLASPEAYSGVFRQVYSIKTKGLTISSRDFSVFFDRGYPDCSDGLHTFLEIKDENGTKKYTVPFFPLSAPTKKRVSCGAYGSGVLSQEYLNQSVYFYSSIDGRVALIFQGAGKLRIYLSDGNQDLCSIREGLTSAPLELVERERRRAIQFLDTARVSIKSIQDELERVRKGATLGICGEWHAH